METNEEGSRRGREDENKIRAESREAPPLEKKNFPLPPSSKDGKGGAYSSVT